MPSFETQEIQVSRIPGVCCFEAIANVKGTVKPSPVFTSLLLQTNLTLQCAAGLVILTNAKSMKLHNVPRAQVSYCDAAMSRVYASMGSIQNQALLSFVADCRPVRLCSGLSWCGLDDMPHGRTMLVGSCSPQH